MRVISERVLSCEPQCNGCRFARQDNHAQYASTLTWRSTASISLRAGSPSRAPFAAATPCSACPIRAIRTSGATPAAGHMRMNPIFLFVVATLLPASIQRSRMAMMAGRVMVWMSGSFASRTARVTASTVAAVGCLSRCQRGMTHSSVWPDGAGLAALVDWPVAALDGPTAARMAGEMGACPASALRRCTMA